MLTDDATLTYMKSGYLEGDRPSRDDALEMIDEIKRIRAELAAMTEQLDLANRRIGELAHAPRTNLEYLSHEANRRKQNDRGM
jgi:hypothetical protein